MAENRLREIAISGPKIECTLTVRMMTDDWSGKLQLLTRGQSIVLQQKLGSIPGVVRVSHAYEFNGSEFAQFDVTFSVEQVGIEEMSKRLTLTLQMFEEKFLMEGV